MKRNVFIALFCACLFGVTGIFAAPAISTIHDEPQPDGETFRAKWVGDEHLNYLLTEDGYVVVQDLLGFYSYADENGDGSGIYVHNVERRTAAEIAFLKSVDPRKTISSLEANAPREEQKFDYSTAPMGVRKMLSPGNGVLLAAPMTNSSLAVGNKKVLVVLMQFPDLPFSMENPVAEYEDFFNKKGYDKNYNKGSVRDYFWENSQGKLNLNFDVLEPVTLSKNKAEYGYNQTYLNGGITAAQEALSILIQKGEIDFSKYDNDGDGLIDFVVIVHSGTDAAGGKDRDAIWAHKGTVNSIVNNKLRFYQYACVGEINARAYKVDESTKILEGIGMISHEFSHMLGLMDLYDTQKGTAVIKEWDLMDYGNYSCEMENISGCSPPYYSAFERMYLGWLTPTVIDEGKEYTLESVDKNVAYKITSPWNGDNDYYLVEYRSRQGLDAAQTNHGMLIWKIHFDETLWNNNRINAGGSGNIDLVRNNSKNIIVFPGNLGVTKYDGFNSKAYGYMKISGVAENEKNTSVTFTVEKKKVELPEFTGTNRYPLALIQFADVEFQKDNAEYKIALTLNDDDYRDQFNKYGSVRKYFVDNSQGTFMPLFDLLGPVTLSKEESYYTQKGKAGMQEAFNEAISILLENDVDFSKYEKMADGSVAFFHGVFAGPSRFYDGKTLIQSATLPVDGANGCRSLAENLCVGKFSVTSELDNVYYDDDPESKVLSGIGYFIYEFSKSLGLKVNDDELAASLDVMGRAYANCENRDDGGCYPLGYSAYEKMKLGWLKPHVLTESGSFTMTPVSAGGAYQILNPDNDKEFYLLELRQDSLWDFAVYNRFNIWHVDTSSSNESLSLNFSYVKGSSVFDTFRGFNEFIWDDGTDAGISVTSLSYGSLFARNRVTISVKFPGASSSSSSQNVIASSTGAQQSSSSEEIASSSSAPRKDETQSSSSTTVATNSSSETVATSSSSTNVIASSTGAKQSSSSKEIASSSSTPRNDDVQSSSSAVKLSSSSASQSSASTAKSSASVTSKSSSSTTVVANSSSETITTSSSSSETVATSSSSTNVIASSSGATQPTSSSSTPRNDDVQSSSSAVKLSSSSASQSSASTAKSSASVTSKSSSSTTVATSSSSKPATTNSSSSKTVATNSSSSKTITTNYSSSKTVATSSSSKTVATSSSSQTVIASSSGATQPTSSSTTSRNDEAQSSSSKTVIASSSGATQPTSSSTTSRNDEAQSSSSKTVIASSSGAQQSSSSKKVASSSSAPRKDETQSSSTTSRKGETRSSSSKSDYAVAATYAPLHASLYDGVLFVTSAPWGVKTVRVFSMNGNLLYTESFTQSSAQIELPQTLRNLSVIVQIRADGKLLKSFQSRIF